MDYALPIIIAMVYVFLVSVFIGTLYSIRNLWREWREQCRDQSKINQRMLHIEMRRKIGL